MHPPKRLILALALFLAHYAQAQVGDTTQIAFLSDTQDPTWIETLFLKTHRNADGRKMIFRDILEGEARAVIHLGDMISSGSDADAWKPIDRFTDSLRAKGSAFHPIPGNHEYFLFPSKGKKNFDRRFPDVTTTGYLVRFSNAAVVLLNSNFSRLSREERDLQGAWYRETLAHLDADSSLEFVIVGCHHPPYTNSTIVSPSYAVDTAFVPPFLAARKTVLFVSGHAHAFEHYRRGGKDFLVIGGGGGLQQPLLMGERRRYEDLYTKGGKTRMYHYLVCNIEPARLRLEIRMIRDDFSGFDQADSLEFVVPPVHMEAGGRKKTPSP